MVMMYLFPKTAGLLAKVGVKAGGFAREELLLGTLVAGGLGVFGVAVGVPWHSILASDQSKVVTLVKQIESANLKFYQQYGYWPNEATDGDPAANVVVLMDKSAATGMYISPSRYHPLIEADLRTDDNGKEIHHRYSGGGVVREMALNESEDPNYRFVITLDNLSLADARKLDEALDGKFDPAHGRLRITYTGERAVARYLANPRLVTVADAR